MCETSLSFLFAFKLKFIKQADALNIKNHITQSQNRKTTIMAFVIRYTCES